MISSSTKPKYKAIFEKLQSGIAKGYYKVGQPLPAQHELMKKFGVSLSTIRQSVAELEKEGWVRAQHGKGCYVLSKNNDADSEDRKLDQGLGFTILCPRLNHPSYMIMLRGATTYLRKHNIELSLGVFDPTNSKEIDDFNVYIKGLRRVAVAGEITMDVLNKIPKELYSKLIFVGHFIEKECIEFAKINNFSTIKADAVSSGYLAAQMLIMAGHKRIGIVTGKKSTYYDEIKSGFFRACEDADLPSPRFFKVSSVIEELDVMEEISEMTDLTGIIVQGDLNSYRFVRRFRSNDYNGFRKISIVGMDGSPRASLDGLNLSRINFNLELVGEEAAKAIMCDDIRCVFNKVVPVKVELGNTVELIK